MILKNFKTGEIIDSASETTNDVDDYFKKISMREVPDVWKIIIELVEYAINEKDIDLLIGYAEQYINLIKFKFGK